MKKSSILTVLYALTGPGCEYSEKECLNLAIYVPIVDHMPDGGLPVVCVIHGGKNTNGGNANPTLGKLNIEIAMCLFINIAEN